MPVDLVLESELLADAVLANDTSLTGFFDYTVFLNKINNYMCGYHLTGKERRYLANAKLLN